MRHLGISAKSPRYIAAVSMAMTLLASSAAMACQCGVLDLSRRIAEADLVLVATVSSFKTLHHVTVVPTEVFKGSASKVLTIQTGLSDCDFFLPPVRPNVGEEYLLFIRQSEGRLIANRCLASGLAAERGTDLRALREAR